MHADCRCSDPDKKFPLASFCSDDLFCPQCGARVAWLTSPNALGNPDPVNIKNIESDRLLWVYDAELGGKGNRFTFPLEYQSLNENRMLRPRRLILDANKCRVEPLNWPYKFAIELVESHEQHKVQVRLKPDPALVREYGETDWSSDDVLMPARGIVCKLTLAGNCGNETFGLLICGAPKYQIEVHESGQRIMDSPPDDAPEFVERAWALSRRGPHELSIFIRCVKGFLHLPEVGFDGQHQNPMVSGLSDGNFVVGTSPPADGVLGPGHNPCKVTISFDSKNWRQGELMRLNVDFSLDVLVSGQVPIHLYLEPRGDVGFRPQGELRIDRMYYKQVESSKPDGTPRALFTHLKVFNRGERALQIRRPYVEQETLREIDWIQVSAIGGAIAVSDAIELELDKPIELSVKIDLARVSSANHPHLQPLRAKILIESLQDERPPWELPVVIVSVRERPALQSPLAIDFGNSNSYAVIERADRLVPVLGDEDPENFPTALYLQDIPDATLSQVVIGKEAIEMGKQDPSSMVRLLKRWFLADADGWEAVWPIRTSTGRQCDLQPSELIRLFIEKVILVCESVLHETVAEIGLSYPANYGPRARKRFDEVIEALEKNRKAAYPHIKEKVRVRRISTIDSSPDEASAVAIGFVHDSDRFRNEVEPRLGPDRTFLVAPFDFGGGSIDCALLRFTFIGNEELLKFKSSHLSLGGDESFGGDTVTVAVGQMLLIRFRALLQSSTPALEFPVAEASENQSVGTDRWNNYQHLQVLAEELKRYLCQLASGADELEAQPAGSSTSPTKQNRHPGSGATSSSPQATTSQAGPLDQERVAPIGSAPSLEHLETAVTVFLSRIKVRDPATGHIAPLSNASSKGDVFLDVMLKIRLEDIYKHKISPPHHDDPAYSVYERVQKCILQLHGFVAKARKEGAKDDPLFVVLAGNGGRLPLVQQLLEKKFDDAVVIGNPLKELNSNPKSKVTYGLARFLSYLKHAPARVEELSRAGAYTHGPIVWRGGIGETFEWVPTCFPLSENAWQPLNHIPLSDCLREGRKIDVYHKAFRLELIGTFDLSEQAREGPADRMRELPPKIDDKEPSEVLLKVDGSEDQLFLMVRYGKIDGNWREFGDWRLISADDRNV